MNSPLDLRAMAVMLWCYFSEHVVSDAAPTFLAERLWSVGVVRKVGIWPVLFE